MGFSIASCAQYMCSKTSESETEIQAGPNTKTQNMIMITEVVLATLAITVAVLAILANNGVALGELSAIGGAISVNTSYIIIGAAVAVVSIDVVAMIAKMSQHITAQNEKRKLMQDAKDGEISELDTKLKNAEAEKLSSDTQYQETITELNKNISTKETEHVAAQRELQNFRALTKEMAEELEESPNTIKKHIEEATEEFKEVEAKHISLTFLLEDVDQKIEDYRNNYFEPAKTNSAIADQDFASLETLKNNHPESFTEDQQMRHEQLKKNSETCKRELELADTELNKLVKNQQELDAQLQETTPQLDGKIEKLKHFTDKLDKALGTDETKRIIEKKDLAIEKLSLKNDSLQKEVQERTELEGEIKDLVYERDNLIEELSSLETEFGDLQKNMKILTRDEKSKNTSIGNLKTEIKEKKEKLAILNEQVLEAKKAAQESSVSQAGSSESEIDDWETKTSTQPRAQKAKASITSSRRGRPRASAAAKKTG